MMIRAILAMCLGCMAVSATAQEDTDAFFIRSIYDHTLTEAQCYPWLDTLSTAYPGRIAGSVAYDGAASYTGGVLARMEIDSVIYQPCTVNYWERGAAEEVVLYAGDEEVALAALALGNSIPTPVDGVKAAVIEVFSLDEVDSLAADAIRGKIVFYNRPMDPQQVRTFNAYGGAVDQRVYGASRAAARGAVAVVVRSMTLALDDVPHTGTLVYDPLLPKIPAVAISTLAADELSKRLSHGPVSISVRTSCVVMGERPSHNVIAEIKGTTYPDEIIVVGGHLDSWDVGGGAHDDGAGCVHAMQVLQTLLDLGYQPQRTIRCVLFSNEENGLAGALAYAEQSNADRERHIFALESDSGGFSPRGFSFDADKGLLADYYRQVSGWLPLLEPYGLSMTTGGSGADISRLKSQGGLLAGLRPDSQRYFDFHHTDRDRIEGVHKRELELGAAAMTSLVYLIDKYGL